jgi:hypothetical protein
MLSWADIEKTSYLVIKTVLSIQLAGSKVYDDYAYVKQFVYTEKVSEWIADKPLPGQRWVEMVSHFNRNSSVPFLPSWNQCCHCEGIFPRE